MANPNLMLDLYEELRSAPEPDDFPIVMQFIRDEMVKRGFEYRYFESPLFEESSIIFDNPAKHGGAFGSQHQTIWVDLVDGQLSASADPCADKILCDIRNPACDLVDYVETIIRIFNGNVTAKDEL